MKKLIIYSALLILLGSCGNSGSGELTGVKGRKRYYAPDPFGMVYVLAGSYTMGIGDEDMPYAQLNNPKTVTVQAFYMDQTEITNNEYRQFVYWVRDSIARYNLGQTKPEFQIIEDKKTKEPYTPPYINWETKLDWNSDQPEVRDVLAQMYLPENERYYRRKEIDTRKLY